MALAVAIANEYNDALMMDGASDAQHDGLRSISYESIEANCSIDELKSLFPGIIPPTGVILNLKSYYSYQGPVSNGGGHDQQGNPSSVQMSGDNNTSFMGAGIDAADDSLFRHQK